MQSVHRPIADDSRVILHFDYDSFYATSVELAQPSLRSLPLAIQQKQIIVTCNYEARRRGLRKLQLLTEARWICPDVVVVSGEDLDRFRDASKLNFVLLSSFIAAWGGRAERLGMDEVWLDASEIVSWNLDRLVAGSARLTGGPVPSDSRAWFALSRSDSDNGFWFDIQLFAGHVWPKGAHDAASEGKRSDRAGGSGMSPLEMLMRGAEMDPETRHGVSVDARLQLGSHLAAHARGTLEEQRGYTAAAGVCVNKTLAKLAGNVHKPRAQTTVVGPFFTGIEMDASPQAADPTTPDDTYGWGDEADTAFDQAFAEQAEYFDQYYAGSEATAEPAAAAPSKAIALPPLRSVACDGAPVFDTALAFVSRHDISKIPGIGFKTASALRAHFEHSPPPGPPTQNPVYTHQPGSHEPISAGELRLLSGMGVRLLSSILARPGAPRDLGDRVWALLHGVDHAPVTKARSVPVQISIEDSYIKLDDPAELRRQLVLLSARLIGRMRTDLKENGRWTARPAAVRLSTRGRSPRDARGTRIWMAKRFSRQAAMPGFVFGIDPVEIIAEKLVAGVLMGLFRALNPEKGWDLSVVNVAATGIYEMGGKDGDIRNLFGKGDQRQDVVREASIPRSGDDSPENMAEDEVFGEGTADVSDDHFHHAEDEVGQAQQAFTSSDATPLRGSEDFLSSQASVDDDAAGEEWTSLQTCDTCGALMPMFAYEAHLRFHLQPD